ncbi:hypothetical protein [Bremerella sp.]|uniref:hypothetical protein n=1 Tax=Bremerella sp. TaxID=2795602 RepID=UPI00391CBBB7
MKKPTLWKRIFGQKPNKKVKAQQAFQEQFDTKLRFRELEPRVVLAAAVLDGSGNLTITIDDGDTVELGRSLGDLTITGITSLDDNGTITSPLATDVYTFSLTEFASVTVNAGADGGSASELVFANTLGDITSSFTTGDLSINGIDLVDIGDSLDSIKIGGDLKASNTGNSDNSEIGNDGTAVLEGTNVLLNEDTGDLDINLNDSEHKFTGISGTASSVLYKDADNIELGALVADTLEITAGDTISDVAAADKIEVSGLASFSGNEVDLDNTTSSGHDFSKLTLNSANAANIKETDGFNFASTSHVDGILTINTGGAIGQTAGSQLIADNAANFTVGDTEDVNLALTNNRFEGAVSVTGQTDRAGAVSLYDNNGGLQFGSVLATTIDATTFGAISQTIAGIDISSTAVFTSLGADTINLSSANNAFGGNVSAIGNGGPAGTVTIVDSLGTLTLDDVRATTLNATAINGGIAQTATGIEVSGTSTFIAADSQSILLNGSMSNKFGTVSAKGATGAADSVIIDDSDGGVILGEINATTLTVIASTFIDQTIDGVKVSGTADFTSGDGENIDLNNSSSNQFSTVHAAGATGAAGNVLIEDGTGDLTLGAIDAASLNAKAAAQILQTTDGVKVSGTTTLTAGNGSNIDLNDSTMNQFATVSAKGATGAAGTVSIADSDNGIILDAIHAGTLDVSAATTIGQTASGIIVTGTATFKAGDGENIDLDGSIINQFGVFAAMGQTGAAGDVDVSELGEMKLGAINAASLDATATTNILQTSDGVKVSSTASFVVGNGFGINLQSSTANEFTTVSAKAASGTAGTFALNDSTGNLELDDVQVGSLVVSTVGEITQTNTGVKVAGTSSLTSGDGEDILLSTSLSNSFGDAVSASGATGAAGHLSVSAGVGDLKLGAIDSTSATLHAVAGKIWQTTDGVQVSGNAQFTSGSGKDILLNSSSNNILGGEVDLVATSGTPANVEVNNSGTNLLLDQVEASGNLTIMTNGNITQTNVDVTDYVQVGGTASFTVSDGANVELGTNTKNKFNTVNAEGQSGAAGDVLLYDSDGNLTLGEITATNLTAKNGDSADILDTMTTAIEVSGLTSLTANNVLLNLSTAKHQINELTLDAAGNASIVELNGFSFEGTNTVDGNLIVNAGGAIDQPTGSLTVMGTTDITSSSTITLTQSTNDFQDNIALSGSDVAIVDANEIKLGNVTANSFDVRALMGKIYQDGGTALDIATTTLAKATDTFDVILDQAGNDFTGAVSVLGFSMPANVVLMDVNDLIIGDIDSETLTATAGKSITQDMGTSILADTSVSLDAGTTITLRDIVTPMLDLTAGGAIDQESGTSVQVSGMTTVEVPVAANVDLSENDNQFGSISVNATLMDYAGTVTIFDSTGDLELKDIWADVLDVTVENGSVTQAAGTSIHAKTSISLDVDGAMVLGDITAPMLDLTAGGAISQDAGTALIISGMTTIEVPATKSVDLSETGNEFGSISINATSMVYAGTVTIYDGGNDNADAILGTADDALTLKDIYAATLSITTAGAEGHIDQQMGTGVHITGMTMVEVEKSVNVDLSNTANELASISVNATLMDYAGTVSIYDSADDLILKDIWATDLDATTVGKLSDNSDASLVRVTGLADFNAASIALDTTTDADGHKLANVRLTTSAGDAKLKEASGFTFDGISSIMGDLVVTSTGSILDKANTDLSVTGLADLTATEIDLSNTTAVTGHSLNKVTVVTTGADPNDNVSILELDGFTFAGVNTILGSLTVTSGGTISDQTDTKLSVGDLTDLTATSIDLDNTTAVTGHSLNQVTFATTAGDASLNELDGFEFVGTNDIQGALTVSTSGSITQPNGTLTVTGVTDLTVGEDKLVTLDKTNDFQGAVNIKGATERAGDVTLFDKNAITLGGIVAKNLDVTATGAISDAADASILDVTELTYLSGASITLDTTTNADGHKLADVRLVTTAGDAKVTEFDGFEFEGTNDIQGNLVVITGGGITQPSGTLTVTKTTDLTVGEGEDITLDKANDFQGTVSIKGATERAGDVTLVDINAIEFGGVVSEKLNITAGGDITQAGGTHLDIMTQTILGLTSKATIELLNVGNDLSTDVQLDTDTKLDRVWDFEIRNENVGAVVVPGGDFENVVKGGLVDDLTLEFVNAPTLTLPEIKITDDLRIVVAGHLTQSGSIEVGDTAEFDAGSMTLAKTNSLSVTNNASFSVDLGDLNVGVDPTMADDATRGTVVGAKVNLGTVTFSAAGQNVTISEDDAMNLAGGNVAKTVYLRSEASSIETNTKASLSVDDLAAFKASTDISLGNADKSDVDLRILLLDAGGNVSIVEQSLFTDSDADNTALALMDGTKVTGTLAIETGGHLIQVNDVRSNGTGEYVSAGKALFDVDGSILLTKTTIGSLAASAGSSGASALNVTPTSVLAFDSAGVMPISSDSGFTTKATLTTDTIDKFLPDQNTDTFAVAARASGFDDAVGEDYSIVVINEGDLTIDTVSDTLGGVGSVDGLRTFGDEAGDVFLYAKAGGDLNFGKMAPAGTIVGLANSGVITALAADQLVIGMGYNLVVTSGDDPDADAAFAAVSKVDAFTDNPASDYEIVDKAPILPSVISPSDQNDGPVYSRVPGNVDTYVLPTQTGKDSVATIVLDKLGIPGEFDFEVTLDFQDTTTLQVEPYATPIAAETAITHDIPWEFATTKASTTVTINAFNSPQINIFEMVVSDSEFNNLNVVVDQFKIFFLTPIDYVPEMTNFVAPNNPYVAPILPPEATPTPYASLTEIADDTRVATQIDGVTVVEVDPSNFMEKGEKVELDDDFMTLDAVKEYIQNGVQFPVGLYKIEILYPGAEEPEVYFYWKQDRLDPFDLFSNNTKPAAPQAAELAAANQATGQLSAEEVWAREYDKWFPTAAELQSTDDLSVPAAEGDTGEMIPSEDDILLERVTTVSLQEIDRMTDRLRAKRSIVRDSLNGAMIGGAALMAAVAAQGRRDDEATNHHPDENGEQPEESLDETSLGRLRRRVRQWL